MPALTIQINYPSSWRKRRHRDIRFLSESKPHSMVKVLNSYDEVSRRLRQRTSKRLALTAEDIFIFETYRLALMESIYLQLNPRAKVKVKEVVKAKNWRTWIVEKMKMALLIFAGIVGTLEMGMWTYFGSAAAVGAMMPAILAIVIIPFSIVFTIISILQFIGFEFDKVRQMFGISMATKTRQTLDVQLQQVKCAKKINQALDNRHIHARLRKDAVYDDYCDAAKVFNMDVQLKKDTFKEYKETRKKKILRMLVIGFGACLTLIEAYFGTQMLIGMVLVSLSTPMTAAIIVTIMASSLVLYFSTRGSGVDTLFNSLRERSHKLSVALNNFEQPLHHHELDQPVIARVPIRQHAVPAPDAHRVKHSSTSKNCSSRFFGIIKKKAEDIQTNLSSMKPKRHYKVL